MKEKLKRVQLLGARLIHYLTTFSFFPSCFCQVFIVVCLCNKQIQRLKLVGWFGPLIGETLDQGGANGVLFNLLAVFLRVSLKSKAPRGAG